MFTNLILFTIGNEVPTFQALGEAMEGAQFTPCGPTQPESMGWVPARGIEHGALLEAVGGQWVALMKFETRLLPAAVVRRRVNAMADAIEKQTGRRPKGKAMRELKEEATHELLSKSFTRQSNVAVWIDPVRRLITVDTASAKRAEVIAMALVGASPMMNLHNLRTTIAPDHLMTAWVMDGEAAADFSIDRKIELRGDGDNHPVLTLSACDVTSHDVQQRIRQGMRVSKLSMTYGGRTSFTLHANGTIKGVTVLAAEAPPAAEGDADPFDATVAIVTGELKLMIDAIVAELGGILAPPIEAAANAESGAPASSETPTEAPPPHDGDTSTDPLFDKAVAIVRQHKRASISLVQRYLRIGYNRAARLLERMEHEGVVTPCDTQGNRELVGAEEGAAS